MCLSVRVPFLSGISKIDLRPPEQLSFSDQAANHRGPNQGSDSTLESCTGGGTPALGPEAGRHGMQDLFPILRVP